MYAKAPRLVTVARVLASAAVPMDIVKLAAKVNLVPALVAISRLMAHAAVLRSIRVLTVRLVIAARAADFAALRLPIANLDAKANLALAPATVNFRLTEHVVARMALRADRVVLEIVALPPDTAAARRLIARLGAKSNLVLALGTAMSHLTELVVGRKALRAAEVVLGIAALRPDTAAAPRRIARLDVRRHLIRVPPALIRSNASSSRLLELL
jgi:hypothetical protein